MRTLISEGILLMTGKEQANAPNGLKCLNYLPLDADAMKIQPPKATAKRNRRRSPLN